MQKFGISILVKDFGEKEKSKFSFKCTIMMKNASVDIGWDDMLMNYTKEDDMVMKGGKAMV